MRIFVTLLSVLAFSTVLNACNTIEGAGQDIQKGGAAIADAADNAKN